MRCQCPVQTSLACTNRGLGLVSWDGAPRIGSPRVAVGVMSPATLLNGAAHRRLVEAAIRWPRQRPLAAEQKTSSRSVFIPSLRKASSVFVGHGLNRRVPEPFKAVSNISGLLVCAFEAHDPPGRVARLKGRDFMCAGEL